MTYFKAVIYVSLFSFLCQGIANTDMSIISQLTHQHGNSWTPRNCSPLYRIRSRQSQQQVLLFVGNFGYMTYILMGLVFMKLSFTAGSLTLILIGSLIGGLIASVFYNSLYNYVNVLSRIDNRELKYFGILQGITQACNVYGNVLSALLIQPLGQFYYVLIMAVLIIFFSLFFLGVREPDPEHLSPLVEESNQDPNINNGDDKPVSDYLL